MNSNEIRKRFLQFFEDRGHKIIPSASLIPENDPSVLFITAGMQPLVPYLLGEKHPLGNRLASVQKCIRTVDIDSIGDKTHLTFFEMLGNWSFGDYFKKDAIKWSYELLTSKDQGFGLDPARLYITVFEGDENVPRDDESVKIWQSVGVPANRIYYMSADSNWWQAGDNGPSGPDTEIFYDVSKDGLGDLTKEEFKKADNEQKVVEIWNDVFMEYKKQDGKIIGKLPNRNVDTGAGLERLAMVLQKKDNIFETDFFTDVWGILNEISPNGELRLKRIIADHLRTIVFLINEGVLPSNTDQGYILRRLIRRTVRFGKQLGLKNENYKQIIKIFIEKYSPIYSSFLQNIKMITEEFLTEMDRFNKTLEKGLKEFNKISNSDISGVEAFRLFSSYGFPVEITVEMANERGIKVDIEGFKKEFEKHQTLSRKGAEQKFKGGLADQSPTVVKYHTATHLLHQALRDVLGDHVTQKGSNITADRLRFDFTHGAKMTEEQKQKVEDIVNQKIKESLPVQRITLSKKEAEKTGALHFFGEKYGDRVSVYFVGNDLKSAYSKEFCGGPHVKNTSELDGVFKIKKEESVAQGVRRIKAILV